MFGPGLFRLLLALVVVMHHSTPIRLGSWAVYVFFILSGYWISRMWEERYCRTRRPWVTFLVSRWWRLAPVFLVALALAAISYRLWGRSMAEQTFLWGLRQIPIVGSTIGGRLLPPQWSLDVEMQFYLAAGLLLPMLRMATIATAVSLLAIPAMGFSLCYLYRGGEAEAPVLWPWLGFFLAGACIWHRRWTPSRGKAWAGMGAFALVTLATILVPATRGGFFVVGAIPVAPHLGHWPAVWQALGALFALPFVAVNVQKRSGGVDRALGNWAYPLYLIHWLGREWYYGKVDWSQPWWQNAGLLAMNLAGVLSVSLAMLWLVDRPFDRMRARWVRGRSIPAGVASPIPAAAGVC